MLKETLEVFENMLQAKGERIILDAYIPKDGTYRLIEKSNDGWNIKDTIEIKYDKKNKVIQGENEENYSFIRELDYYSKLIDMNKPIDSKKVIHTNNYLSIAVKKDSIISGKWNEDVFTKYYEVLKDPSIKYQKNSKTRALYADLEKRIGSPDKTLIHEIEEYVKNSDIWKDMDLNQKDYAKVFFVFSDQKETIALYKKECNRYLIPNIYNNNEFNELDGQEIVGLPNNNMGLNSKKPYLENKSRKIKVPYLLNQEETLLQGKLFDYLWGQVCKGKYHFYINGDDLRDIKAYDNKEEPQYLTNGYYIRCKKEKNEAAILDADVISRYDPNLRPAFVLKNDIGISEEMLEKIKIQYGVYYNRLWEIRKSINNLFFEGKLVMYLNTEPKDILIYDAKLKQCLLECRNSFIGWFYQGQTLEGVKMFERISLRLIEYSVLKGENLKAQRQFNLRWSILDYYMSERSVSEKMKNIKMTLREKINKPKEEEWVIESQDEFSFGVGQLISYLSSLSKSNKKNHSSINFFLNAKNSEIIKKRIIRLYEKYNYQIKLCPGGRFEQLLEHILEYDCSKINKEALLIGFVSTNLIYEKKIESEEQ